MKTKKLSLRCLEESEISQSEMKDFLGGDHWERVVSGGVRCGCRYEGTKGGSSTNANNDANVASGKWTEMPKVSFKLVCEPDAIH